MLLSRRVCRQDRDAHVSRIREALSMTNYLLAIGLLFSVLTGPLLQVPEAAYALDEKPPGDSPGAEQSPLTDSGGPRRRPPRAAIEACTGKKEGDTCSFNAPDGILSGECRSGRENVFGCRPHRGVPGPETAPTEKPDSPEDAAQRRPGPASDTKPAAHQAEPAPPPRAVYSPPQASAENTGSRLLQYAGIAGASAAAAALLAGGLTWLIFFRSFILPLRRLRKVTQQLAAGNLAARVGEGLVHKRDEVADLGRDVDHMAERIEGLVGAQQRLIRDVSHELRSPLARLNVALELARQSAGPALSAPFDRIERESERLNELISQLLMLTRLESESGLAEKTDFDMAVLVAEVAQDVDFEARSQGRGVAITKTEPLLLSGNRELLRQALENLIRNAVRYTAENTVAEIELNKKKVRGHTWAAIRVRDQGPGVPEAELRNIFRPFYRVNDARERQSGGSGVGLAIADRAVYLHGGSLQAANAVGGGLIMEMELPLAG